MPYNFVTDSIDIKKLCSRLFSSEVHFLTENGRFAFMSRLGAYERRMLFILSSLVITELFR